MTSGLQMKRVRTPHHEVMPESSRGVERPIDLKRHPQIMHILIRKISPYTGADILLGVFTDAASAEFTRSLYWQMRANDAEGDPWHKQCYRPDGLKSDDLQISPVAGPEFKVGEEVFVLSNYGEGMGSAFRKIVSIYQDARIAQLDGKRIELEEQSLQRNSCFIQKVRVGELLSDSPKEQPRF